ncbi:MAG: Trm112 family protein [Roseovarius sp.]|uniref:Trm112 family protein n=1 Tax=Roseovarius sp. TaxID=1486281 RepID=UPI0040592B90
MSDWTDPPQPSETGQERETSGPGFDRRMLEALLCPQTHGRLDYDAERQELVSKSAKLAFPIRNGIPVMLIDEARQID